MNTLSENVQQITDLFASLTKSQNSNVASYTDNNSELFANVLDNLQAFNNSETDQEKNISKNDFSKKELISQDTKKDLSKEIKKVIKKEGATKRNDKKDGNNIVDDETKNTSQTTNKDVKSKNKNTVQKNETEFDKNTKENKKSENEETIEANNETQETQKIEATDAIYNNYNIKENNDDLASIPINFQTHEESTDTESTQQVLPTVLKNEILSNSNVNLNITCNNEQNTDTQTNMVSKEVQVVDQNNALQNLNDAFISTQIESENNEEIVNTIKATNTKTTQTNNLFEENISEDTDFTVSNYTKEDLQTIAFEIEDYKNEVSINTENNLPVEEDSSTGSMVLDNDTNTNIKTKVTSQNEIKENTPELNEILEKLIDETDVEELEIDADNSEIQNNKTSIKENLNEIFLKTQISNENTNVLNKNEIKTNQLDIKDALKTQVNEIKTEETANQTTQNNFNFTQENTSIQNSTINQSNNTQSNAGNTVNFSSEISKLTQNAKTAQTTAGQTPTKNDVLNQITSKFEQLKDGTTSKVNIILRPENLGKVGVELVSRPDGVSARILADTQQIKELLDKNLDMLKSSLQTQGVNVNNLVVKVVESSQQSEMNFGQNLDFAQQDNSEKNEKLSSDTTSDYKNRKKQDEENDEQIQNNYQEDEQEEMPELREAELLYTKHSGKVDLVV